ncbi:MAG: hypothetical protein KKE39_01650 [Bacteroidetes bacterium]|nr:hypothetical protein [Bacteroidota bacterium]MBU1371536.1 hypothetical protein [Bacteroidota bacterium]MBU1485155.1 hypothetical protein [Bacteroidota bacterium]MBU1760374.1 hypothetical protein [Bacteroidota bacterium]MBU2266614.1 hypothetical protein [Bacteroidota bacterium]
MKIFTKAAMISSGLILGLTSISLAQTPLSGFMQGKNGGSVSFSLTNENYKHVFLYPDEIDETPIFNKVSTSSFNIYGTYGLSDKLDIIFNVPFIQTSGSANADVLKGLGYTNQRSGAQDLSAFLKYELAKKGNVSIQGSLGITTPLSDYKVDESLQSIIAIGNHATTFNGILLGQYKSSNSPFFVSGQIGYSLRSTAVPDAILSQLKAGFAFNRLYFDGYVGNQTSTGGVDILRNGFNGSFPATKVNYTKVGGSIYTPLDGNFGISGGGGAIVDGRNIGKSWYANVGVTYNFKYNNNF